MHTTCKYNRISLNLACMSHFRHGLCRNCVDQLLHMLCVVHCLRSLSCPKLTSILNGAHPGQQIYI